MDAGAESEFKRALELSPDNSEAHLFYARFLSLMGRNDEALAEARRAQQADPLFRLQASARERFYCLHDSGPGD